MSVKHLMDRRKQSNVPRHAGVEIIGLASLCPCGNSQRWAVVSDVLVLSIWTVLSVFVSVWMLKTFTVLRDAPKAFQDTRAQSSCDYTYIWHIVFTTVHIAVCALCKRLVPY
jgi:uncharacterized membrane protein YedE/YeeE